MSKITSHLSRRAFVRGTGAIATLSSLPLSAVAFAEPAKDPLKSVDPRIATGGHGHCFPGAAVPFGAVQLSPDTYNDDWDWCSGYHISDTSIMGFSHTHLSGTGCGDLLDFLVMPGNGPVKLQPGTRENPETGYRSRFSHDDEISEPGYYSVLLKDPAVHAELTCTERTGLHRYTFSRGGPSWIILDLDHSYLTNKRSSVSSAELTSDAPDTLSGGHITSAWGPKRHAYFSLNLSRKPSRIEFYSDDKLVPTAPLKGKNLKAVLHFDLKPGDEILIRTGISGVSAAGAAKNLAAEQPDWNFARTRTAAQSKWRAQISRIDADFASPTHQRIFYTGLYHMSLGPTLFDDVDGQYRGMDSQIHTLPNGHHNYSTFSLWDTFRAAHPAYTLMQQDRVPDFANTLIRMAEQSPAGMPVWPLQGTETGTMTGYHSASVIAEAIQKGFPGIDVDAAYRVMDKRAQVDDYRGLGFYRKLGYIPADRESESVSKSFEYCYDDWAVAHVARKLGKTAEADALTARSRNFRNNWNPATIFMQPKLADGSWATPFNPIEMGHSKRWRDYTESNAWQTSFGIQHDPAGLIELYGGKEKFLDRLDLLFNQPSTLPADAPPDIAGMVGQYAHGNEPSHHIAYLYVYAGAPAKTQSRVRNLLDTMYHAAPDGMEGNEDVGQMSAWYLLSALGFYPVDPVSGNYILGSPIINRATVNMGEGKKLVIEVKRRDPAHVYIHGFTLNGKRQQRTWFNHTDIASGGHLILEMGPTPDTTLGTTPNQLPPSLGARNS